MLFRSGFPLALDQAGAYIEETSCSLSDYIERYATRRNVLLSNRGGLSDYHPTSVAATLSLSIQQVEQASPSAANLLRFCAFLHAEAIPEEFITRTGETLRRTLQSFPADPLLLDQAIRELRRFSLLHREPETKTLGVHRLVQAIIQDRMDQEERTQWIERIIQTMLEIFPTYENAELSNLGGVEDRKSVV